MRRAALSAAAAALAALGLAGPGLARVDVVRHHEVIPVAGSVEDGCDEPILLTAGRVVETWQEFVDPNGRTHYVLHFQTFGLKGVGLDSGATYTDHSHSTSTGMWEDGLAVGGFTFHVRISSSDGDAATLALRHTFRIVKRDGVNRVLLDRFSVTCA